jgi:hypothetical protein
VAQLVARSVRDAEVGGSSPLAPIGSVARVIIYKGFPDQGPLKCGQIQSTKGKEVIPDANLWRVQAACA